MRGYWRQLLSVLTSDKTLLVMSALAIVVLGVTDGIAAAWEMTNVALMVLGGLWLVERGGEVIEAKISTQRKEDQSR